VVPARSVDRCDHPIPSLDPSLDFPTGDGALPLLERLAGRAAPTRFGPVLLETPELYLEEVWLLAPFYR
jgi:hypothetical protein